jgi:hypothetical protein
MESNDRQPIPVRVIPMDPTLMSDEEIDLFLRRLPLGMMERTLQAAAREERDRRRGLTTR